MSVLIKDMEMPTSCTMCWLNTFCGVWNTEPAKHKGFNKRLEYCPLAEQILCKDCKYNSNTEGNYVNCAIIPQMFGKTPDDNYCSWAERKQDEH